MAEGVGIGFDISKMLKELERADASMDKLIKNNEKLSQGVISAFRQMTEQGVVPYTQSLEKQSRLLDTMNQAITTSAGRAKSGFGTMKQEIDKATASINTLLTALKMSDAFKNETNARQESQADQDRYRDWLALKHKEEKEHKRVEDSKFESTRNAIAQQNAEYKRVADLQNAQRATNQQTRENSERIIRERDAAYKMYAQMFDEVARREKKSLDERARYERSVYEDSLAKYRKNKEDQAKVDKHYHDKRQREYEEMFRALERTEKRQRALDNARGDSSKGALNYYNRLYSDKGVMSLNNMNRALQKLRDAQSKLNLSTDEGKKKYKELGNAISKLEKDLARVTARGKSLKTGFLGVGDIVGQLQRRFALLFSVSQIVGYVKKLASVRGEFELQQRALQAIVQNVDEANKLWDKTVALAVKSPFRVKELVTYTKQLAAYRIETDKLHDTTKRLADVSAGLGVDMSRLILAYGQVRAADFLRGTELRQFTEAGIPMLEELAKHFSELEGRAISVGDVFERISNRLVSFEDVAKVFENMTNEGGVFFEMQEKQSDTLKGQISNLSDAIDLMLNEIGSANDSVLKNSVAKMKDLVNNWHDVAFAIKLLLPLLTAVATQALLVRIANSKLALSLLEIGMSSKRMSTMLIATEGGLVKLAAKMKLSGSMASLFVKSIGGLATLGIVGGITAIIAVIVGLIVKMTSASRAAERLQKELDKIYNEDTTNLKKQIKEFESLAERLKTVNKGSSEHSAIINELNSKYGEYLGFIVDEKTTYDQLANSIKNVSQALLQKAKINSFEKAYSKVLEETREEIANIRQEMAAGVFRNIKTTKGKAFLPTKDEINDIFSIIEKRVQDTGEKVTVSDFLKIINTYYGIKDLNIYGLYEAASDLQELSEQYLKQLEQAKKIEEEINSVYNSRNISTRAAKREYDELEAKKQKELKNEKSRIKQEKIKRKYAEQEIRLDVKYEFSNNGEQERENIIQSRIKKLDEQANRTIKDINRRLIESTDELGENVVDRIYITTQDSTKGLSGIATSYAEGYKTQQEIIKQQNALKKAGTEYDEKMLADAEAMAKGYKKALKIMGRLDLLETKGKKEKSTKNDEVKERIKLVKKMHEEYSKLNKEYDETEAKQKVVNSYTSAWNETFSKIGANLKARRIDAQKLSDVLSDSTLSEDVKNQLEELKETGGYIRAYDESFVDEIKKREGFLAKAKNIGDGKFTLGYGETKGVKAGDTTTQEVADAKLRNRLTKDFANELNAVLDVNKDLILTQKQYNALLDLAYQGGGGAAINLIKLARDEDEAVKHITNIYNKIKKSFGEKEASRFGEEFVKKFREAENIYERISMLLQTMNLTAKGGRIDKELYQGMQQRADERAASFLLGEGFADALSQASEEISAFDFTTKKGVADFLKTLRTLAESEGEDVRKALELEISNFTAEIGLEAKIKNNEDVMREIEQMFTQYEVSIQLNELELPKDLQKQIFNVDNISLPELRAQVEAKKDEVTGTNQEKKYQEFLDKISELENKELEKRAKKYSKYLVKAQGERVKLKMEELRAISELDEMADKKVITGTQNELAQQNIRKETQAKIDKMLWEEFKDSGMYVRLFEDMEYASTAALQSMQQRLSELKTQLKDLDADDLRNLYNQLEKIEDELAKRNPFKTSVLGIKDYIEALKKRNELEKKAIEEDNKLAEAQKNYNKASDKLVTEKAEYEALDKRVRADGKITKEEQDQLDSAKQRVAFKEGELRAAQQLLDTQKKTTEEANKQNDENKKTIKTFKESVGTVGQYVSQAASALPQVASDMEQVFGAMDASTKDTIDTISEISGGVGEMMTSFASGDIIGTITGLTKTISAIFAIGDKANERQIQKDMKRVERLQKAYEKLEKAIDDAYNINTLEVNTKKARENLEAQIAATERMIKAEDDKKKKDKNRIEQWRDEIDAYKEQLKEMEEQRLETLGGIGSDANKKSMTEDFVDAWLEAFKETGDGLSGLEDKFDEFLENYIKKQMTLKVASKYLDPLMADIDAYLGDDNVLDNDELKLIGERSEQAFEIINKALEGLIKTTPAIEDAVGKSSLSGLSKGIQGVTEEQADILASYWNAVRGYTASIDTKMNTVITLLSPNAANAMYSEAQRAASNASLESPSNQPILAELQSQTQIMREIYSMFDSVIGRGNSSHSGAYLKVLI